MDISTTIQVLEELCQNGGKRQCIWKEVQRLETTLRMEPVCSSEMLVSIYKIAWRYNQNRTLTAVNTSNLKSEKLLFKCYCIYFTGRDLTGSWWWWLHLNWHLNTCQDSANQKSAVKACRLWISSVSIRQSE